MKWFRAIILATLLSWAGQSSAQYSMEEFGMELGPGLSLLLSPDGRAMGPGGNVNAFFSHYACGKRYGFHLQLGMTGMFANSEFGHEILDPPAFGRTGIQFAGLDAAVLGKIRLHEYHRPREWAVFFGPRVMAPLITRYSSNNSSGSLSDVTSTLSRVWPGLELSVQFRNPIGKKKSWFVHPGAAYFFLPAFTSNVGGSSSPLYFFLNFGYAFWDQRG